MIGCSLGESDGGVFFNVCAQVRLLRRLDVFVFFAAPLLNGSRYVTHGRNILAPFPLHRLTILTLRPCHNHQPVRCCHLVARQPFTDSR